MLKYIIVFCSFIITYAILNFAYAIKECCLNSSEQTEEQVEEQTEENKETEILSSKLDLNSLYGKGVFVATKYNPKGIILDIGNSTSLQIRGDEKQRIKLNELRVDEKRKKEIENLLNEKVKRDELLKKLKVDTVKIETKDNLRDVLKNDVNMNIHGNYD